MPRAKLPPQPAPLKAVQMLYNLTKSRGVLEKLLEDDSRVYAPLVREMMNWVGSKDVPTSKALQEKTGTSAAFRRWLERCYKDLMQLLATDASVLQIRETIHQLYLYGDRAKMEVSCKLPFTPRLYEYVELPLVGAETGSYGFYVYNIAYELVFDQLIVHLEL